MKKTLFLFLFIFSTSTYAANNDIRDAKVKKINDTFVEEVVKETKIKAPLIREFLPGGKNYGKRIGDSFKLSTQQKRTVRELEDKKRNDMFAIRKRFGADPKLKNSTQIMSTNQDTNTKTKTNSKIKKKKKK